MATDRQFRQSNIGIYLLAVLCVAGVVTGAIVLRDTYAATVTSTNQANNAAIGGETGIDMRGKRIVAQPPPTEGAALLIVLQSANVDAELSYWSQVARILDHDHVRVVAYCDSRDCIDIALRRRDTGPLTISGYAEVVNFYTVASHNRVGECVLRSEEWLFPKYIPCSSRNDSPEALASRIRRNL
jgi:hypothetical protein